MPAFLPGRLRASDGRQTVTRPGAAGEPLANSPRPGVSSVLLARRVALPAGQATVCVYSAAPNGVQPLTVREGPEPMATVCVPSCLLTAESRGARARRGTRHLARVLPRAPLSPGAPEPAGSRADFLSATARGGRAAATSSARARSMLGANRRRAKVPTFPRLLAGPRPRRSDLRTRPHNAAGRKNSVEHGPLALPRWQTARMRTRGNGPSDMV